MGYEAGTYDTLGNERHKAVCELRNLSDTPSDIWVWKRQLGEAIGADNEMYSSISERLIHLFGGGVKPITLSELFGIWKEGDGGVDAGGCVEACVDRAVYGADGRVADSAGDSHAEGLAPITTVLRNACGDANGMVSFAAIESHDFDRLCDAIDAVHAGLERENAELRRQLESLMLDSRPMTDENMAEHGWVRLPVDADGVPIRVGDVVDVGMDPRNNFTVAFVALDEIAYADGVGDLFTACSRACHHHHAPTVEDVLRDFVSEFNRDDTELCDEEIIERFAAKLRLADGEDA